MKSALATKVAMCVCPTALVATGVATIPRVRGAVHHATRPHHAVLSRHHKAVRTTSSQPCGSPFAGNAPALFTLPVGIDPVGPALGSLLGAGQSSLSSGPGVSLAGGGGGFYLPNYTSGGYAGGGGGGGGGGGSGSGGETTVTPSAPAVPEPATWLFMVAGFGLAGLALRRRASAWVPAGGYLLGGSLPLRAELAGSAAVAGPEAVGLATSAKTAALAKLALCVCPPALIAGSVATVPPLRQAVHSATAPKVYFAPTPGYAIPCDPLFAGGAKAAKPVAALRSIGAAATAA